MLCRMMLPILLLLAAGAHAEQDWEDPWRDVFVFQSKLAKQGNAQAQFKLGEMYEEGRGVSADLHQARYWYEKAAGQGVEEARDRIDALGKSTPSAEQAKAREAERRTKLQEEEEQAARRAAEQEALKREQARQAAEQARLEAERKAQAQRRAQEQAKRREEARRREQERQAALAAQRAREEAARREQARNQALLVGEPQAPVQDAPPTGDTSQAEPDETTPPDKTRFRTNPCEGPAARFTSTCR